MFPKSLARQLRKKLGLPELGSVQHASDHLAELSLEQKAALVDNLPKLFETLSETYENYERDLELRTRSLELSSAELTSANDRLRLEGETNRVALSSLKRTLAELLARDTSVQAVEALDIRAISEQIHQLVQGREAARLASVHAKQAAEDASRAKTEFLAKMSHELRTPMNAILGLTELVLDGEVAPEHRDLLRCVHDSAGNLLQIVNDVLDYSSLEGDRLLLRRELFSLRNVLEDAQRRMAPRAEEKGLELSVQVAFEVPEHIAGDPERFMQIVLNLLVNAVKFTRSGSVRLEANVVSDRAGQFLDVSVIDTGMGIAPDKQALIWNAFSQADNSNARQFGGSGLGLTICYQLLQRMGGAIRLKSAQNVGSEFAFRVPLHTSLDEPIPRLNALGAPPIDIIAPPISIQDSKRPAILISGVVAAPKALLVEDNPMNQQVATRILKKLGFVVEVANDGLEGVACYQNSRFDVVVMDLQMPNLDGLGATRLIRNYEERVGHRTPIIALTANVAQGDRESCFEAGMDDYVTKPIRLDVLREAMQRALPPHSLPQLARA